jgi:hypothetical protein
MIPQINMDDKVVVVGYSGSGKTTYMRNFVKTTALKPLYIVDPIGNFSPNPSWKNYEFSGVMPCSEKRQGHTCIKLSSTIQLEALIKHLSSKKPKWFLIVDEIDRFLGTSPAPYYIRRYIEEGRNYSRGGMFSVRRIGFLNKSILSNAHYLVMFRLLNKNDKEYLNSIVDFDVMELDYSDPHSFFFFDLQRSENLGEMKIRI